MRFNIVFYLVIIFIMLACNDERLSPVDHLYICLDNKQCDTAVMTNKEKAVWAILTDAKIEILDTNRYYRAYAKYMEKPISHYEKYMDSINRTDWLDTIIYNQIRLTDYVNSDRLTYFPLEIDSSSFESLQLSDKYLVLQYLLVNNEVMESDALVYEEKVTLDYILHLMKTNSLQNTFPSIYIRTLLNKGTNFLTENEVDNVRYGLLAEKNFTRALDHARKYKLDNLTPTLQVNLAESIVKQGDTIKAINYLLDIPVKFLNDIDKDYIWNSIAINYRSIDSINKSLTYLDKVALLPIKKSPYLNLEYAATYTKGKQFKKAKLYLQKSKETSVNDPMYEDLYFYTLEEEVNYYQTRYSVNKNLNEIDSALHILKKRRDRGKFIFAGDISFHANEFYTYNTDRYLDLLMDYQNSNNPIPQKYWNQVISHISYTKNLKTISHVENYNRKVGDHDIIDSYDNPIYSEIYHNYFSNIRQEINQTPSLGNFKLTQNKNFHIFRGKNHYWILADNEIEKQLYKASISSVHGEINEYLERDFIDYPKSGILNLINSIIDDDINIHCDGIFNNFPFDILLNNKSSINSWSDKAISINSKNISAISYSDTITNRSLKPLKFTELINGYKECEIISKLFTSTNLKAGLQANRTSFVNAMASDILHISTHAYSDSILRLESYLILRDSLGGPTRLYADEILSMPTVPKFVNLSACQTGTGVHIAGAGTYSIARSFLQKGSEAVMKTLWDVDDKATKEFMILFYTKWKEGSSCGDALYQTKQDFKSSTKYSDPHYWAGFVLEGNPNLYLKGSLK